MLVISFMGNWWILSQWLRSYDPRSPSILFPCPKHHFSSFPGWYSYSVTPLNMGLVFPSYWRGSLGQGWWQEMSQEHEPAGFPASLLHSSAGLSHYSSCVHLHLYLGISLKDWLLGEGKQWTPKPCLPLGLLLSFWTSFTCHIYVLLIFDSCSFGDLKIDINYSYHDVQISQLYYCNCNFICFEQHLTMSAFGNYIYYLC